MWIKIYFITERDKDETSTDTETATVKQRHNIRTSGEATIVDATQRKILCSISCHPGQKKTKTNMQQTLYYILQKYWV